jgi:hypothetical protein
VLRAQPSPSLQSNSNIITTNTSSLSSQSQLDLTSRQLQSQQLQLPWLLNRINSFIISPFIYIANLFNSSSSGKSTDNKDDQRKSLVERGECRTYGKLFNILYTSFFFLI